MNNKKIGYNIIELLMYRTGKTYNEAEIYHKQIEEEIEKEGGHEEVLKRWLLRKFTTKK